MTIEEYISELSEIDFYKDECVAVVVFGRSKAGLTVSKYATADNYNTDSRMVDIRSIATAVFSLISTRSGRTSENVRDFLEELMSQYKEYAMGEEQAMRMFVADCKALINKKKMPYGTIKTKKH